MKKKSPERRIVAHGYYSDGTEVDEMMEAVCHRYRAKIWSLVFMAISAAVVFCLCFVVSAHFNTTPWSNTAWLPVCLCGSLGALVAWLFFWPFAGRSEYWQNAVGFIEAIGYVESVTGRQFEDWSTFDDDVEEAVERALVSELEAICAIQEKDPIKAGDLFAKWRRRHEQMQRLFPSIKGYDELTTLATFLPYDPEADSSVNYCSRS